MILTPRKTMLLNIGGQLFALVPAQSLEAGPEFFNSTYGPHNCVGGSEQGCVPGKTEAYYLFKDPSKMNKEVRRLCLNDFISCVLVLNWLSFRVAFRSRPAGTMRSRLLSCKS